MAPTLDNDLMEHRPRDVLAGFGLGIRAHRSKLVHGEGLAIEAHALLGVEGGARRAATDEQGDQRQVQVHDGGFTTLRPLFAGAAVGGSAVGRSAVGVRTREPRTPNPRPLAEYDIDPTGLGSKLGLLWS